MKRKDLPPLIQQFKPSDLDGIAALIAADHTRMGKSRGERDTEFVKRIVATYLNAVATLAATEKSINERMRPHVNGK